MSNSDNKRIAKNTLYLYFRMMITMAVSLYTSRVILQVLGVTDFGIYQTVGGVVGLMAFLNNALSTGSSRFLTFELGRGDKKRLTDTFSTVLSAHIILGLLLVVAAETIGLWFLYNKLVIPEERMHAAVIAYHLSIVTMFMGITQVPYGAIIISHERMNIYAYTSIVDVVLKLVIVYLITLSSWDKLITYSLLLFSQSMGMRIFYRWYCIHHFNEAHYHMKVDHGILKEVLSYSGWNLFANTSIALNSHGATLLINIFFSPAVVTSRAIANTVKSTAMQFINNFRTAVNPQIVKKYAAGEFNDSKKLLLTSTKYSFFLVLILCLPIFVVAKPLLYLWLGQVPEYSVIFLQISLVSSLFHLFDSSLYTALYAKGRIKENAMISPTLGFTAFPITYILFRLGAPPVALSYVLLVINILLGLVVKPILVVKIVESYTWKDIISLYKPCGLVFLTAVPIPIILYLYRNHLITNSIIQFIVLVGVSIISVAFSCWFLGMDKEMRVKLVNFIKSKIKK